MRLRLGNLLKRSRGLAPAMNWLRAVRARTTTVTVRCTTDTAEVRLRLTGCSSVARHAGFTRGAARSTCRGRHCEGRAARCTSGAADAIALIWNFRVTSTTGLALWAGNRALHRTAARCRWVVALPFPLRDQTACLRGSAICVATIIRTLRGDGDCKQRSNEKQFHFLKGNEIHL